MATSTTLRKFILMCSLMLPVSASFGCGGKADPNAAQLKPAEMPEGAEWKGVYYSSVYGDLHLKEDGGTLVGKWRTVSGDANGEMTGKTEGNLYRYEWTERKIGLIGPAATRSGKGYFKYTRKPAQEGIQDSDELVGQWGLNEKDSGNEWKAVKQKNREPNFKAVEPDEVETAGSAAPESWDKEAGGSGDESEE